MIAKSPSVYDRSFPSVFAPGIRTKSLPGDTVVALFLLFLPLVVAVAAAAMGLDAMSFFVALPPPTTLTGGYVGGACCCCRHCCWNTAALSIPSSATS